MAYKLIPVFILSVHKKVTGWRIRNRTESSHSRPTPGLRQLDALMRIPLFCRCVRSISEMATNRLVDLDEGAVTGGTACGILPVVYKRPLR
jgi:hypothetical protein